MTDELTEFLASERPVVEVERILTTVLFTDIVGSTAQAASLGDKRWRSLLDGHDTTVREQLRRFRGSEINTTGDGFVASFDGPARAIRCAQAIYEATETLDVRLRVGLRTGECEVRGDDLGGLAVHIACPGDSLSRSRRCSGLWDGKGFGCRVGDRVPRPWRARTQRCARVLEAVRCPALMCRAIGPDGGRPKSPGW